MVTSFRGYAVFLVLFGFVGCAHLGARVERGPVASGADAGQLHGILSDLAANDAALHNFKAGGEFTIKSPQSAAVQRCSGSVLFRKPSDLYVVGRGPFGGKEFELRCVKDRYLIWYRGESWTGSGAATVEGISWKVAPSEIVREMFLPENWSKVDLRQARLTDFDAANHKATIVLGPEKRPRRRIEVTGPPWDVTKNELFDPKSGDIVASTELSGYREKSGVRYAKTIDAHFPLQQTRLRFDIRDPELNTQLDESRFTIKETDTP